VPLLLMVVVFVVQWVIARGVAQRALLAEFKRARKGASEVSADATNEEEQEAWAVVASSTKTTITSSSSHSGGALPFVLWRTTFCMQTEVETASGRRRVDLVMEVATRLGSSSVDYEGLSTRRQCTCVTGEDETCKLEEPDRD
jgi:hypothetical protein